MNEWSQYLEESEELLECTGNLGKLPDFLLRLLLMIVEF